MAPELKTRFRLFQRKSGTYFCEDRQTGQQESLRSSDRCEAERLLAQKKKPARSTVVVRTGSPFASFCPFHGPFRSGDSSPKS
jgi:hypothetical protein